VRVTFLWHSRCHNSDAASSRPRRTFVALFPTPEQMQSLIADADDQPVVRSPAIGKQSVAIAAT